MGIIILFDDMIQRKKTNIANAYEMLQGLKKYIIHYSNISDEGSVREAVNRAASEFGGIDILLNDAGTAVPGTMETLSAEDWDRAMNINVRGMFLMCKYIVPGMRARKYGKIVNIASVNAVIADKEPALARHVYNTSKAAVRGLTIALAASYMLDNITVNSIGPGLFESEMTENTLFANAAFLKTYNAIAPAGRPGERGELNGTIIYLSSEASSYVTGQHILVDGGVSIV